MYKVIVPLVSDLCINDQGAALKEIQGFNGEMVMLSLGCYKQNKDERIKSLNNLKANCEFFKQHGYPVGAWIWSLLFEQELNLPDGKFHPFTRIVDSTGNSFNQAVCPMDQDFLKFAKEYIKDIVRCGVDLVLFDDDFGFGYCRSEHPSCFCDLHFKRIKEILGEELTKEELINHIFKEPKNKYRDAYLQANGESLENFARVMREGVDEINPNVRIGYCSCMNSWDVDGTDVKKVARIFAGNTKPFCRLTGAPYWVNPHWVKPKPWSPYLQDVIEFHRMESAWTKEDDIEVVSEGDTFPRPRYNCPASYLEGFDTALRASGCTDGIMKYGIDYFSNSGYETGYLKYHQRNIKAYEWIHNHFDGLNPTGVRIYESMKKISDATPYMKTSEGFDFLDSFFSRAARAFGYNAIPTVYEGKGITGVCFDENARHLPAEAFKNGLIIDVIAAEILFSKGIDVGIKSIGEKKNIWGVKEYFFETKNNIQSLDITVNKIEISENAKVLSTINIDGKDYPMSYLYENANGERFLVFAVNSRLSTNAFRSYERNKLIANSIEWLSGKKLPAHVNNLPALYMICKENKDKLVIGLWNFIEDIAMEPVVDLSCEYKDVECFGGSAKLLKDKVLLSDIQPFSFIFLELTK